MRVRVMTYNLRSALAHDGPNAWELRKDLATGVIREHDPDLLGVQEPTAGQWADVANALGGGWTGVRFALADATAKEQHFAGLFYRTARFEPLAEGVFWLSGTPDVPGSITWHQDWGPRACAWVKLKDRASGAVFVFASAHTDTAGEAWLPSVKVLAAELPARGGGAPVVLVGDFNCSAGCEAHAWLTGPGGFSDAWTAAGLKDAGVMTFNAFVPMAALPLDRLPALEKWLHDTCDHVPQFAHYPAHVMTYLNYRIDWIMLRGGFTVRSAAVDTGLRDGRLPSDHYPVIADLERS